MQSSFRIRLSEPKYVELMRRFDENPYDRLVVACYHLFRTQFDNPIVAPAEQDFAAYCAVFEASLDVDGPEYSRKLADKLTAIYGKEQVLTWWLKGLYSERSVFNHGASSELAANNADDQIKPLLEFRERSLNWDVLRKLCLDVIEVQLQASIDARNRLGGQLLSPIRTMLRRFFLSDEAWGVIAKWFVAKESVKKTIGLTGGKLDDFVALCGRFLSDHDWKAMTSRPEVKKVYDVLRPMAAVCAEFAKAKGDQEGEKIAAELFEFAKQEDSNAIESWARGHTEFERQYGVADAAEATKAIAARTASYFCAR